MSAIAVAISFYSMKLPILIVIPFSAFAILRYVGKVEIKQTSDFLFSVLVPLLAITTVQFVLEVGFVRAPEAGIPLVAVVVALAGVGGLGVLAIRIRTKVPRVCLVILMLAVPVVAVQLIPNQV